MRKKGRSCGIGGQAVLEGVMMKNKDVYAVSVRKPDGQIVTDTEEFGGVMKGSILKRLPFVRGVFNFVDSMILGMRTLNWSVSFYEDEEEAEREKPSLFQKLFGDKADSVVMGITTAFSMVLAVLIFMMLPYFISGFLSGYIRNESLTVIIEGLIRILIFLLYVTGISAMKDIHRLYQYHGAEHKCINCIERGRPLTVKNVMRCSRQHRRCGTSFLLFVMFVSVVLFFFIRVENSLYRMGLRILLIPVIAGISYEIIRLAGNSNHILIRLLSAPGMWLQKLTTKEPDEDMVEVAIASVEAIFDWKAYLKDTFGYVVDDADTDNVKTDKREWEEPIVEESGEWEDESAEENGEEAATGAGSDLYGEAAVYVGNDLYGEPVAEMGNDPYEEAGADVGNDSYGEVAAGVDNDLYEEAEADVGDNLYREAVSDVDSDLYEEEVVDEGSGLYGEAAVDEGNGLYEEAAVDAEENLYGEAAPDEGSGPYEEATPDAGNSPCAESVAISSVRQEAYTAVSNAPNEEPAVGADTQWAEPTAEQGDSCEKPFVIRGVRCEEPAAVTDVRWDDPDSADDDQWEESFVEHGMQYENAAKVEAVSQSGHIVEEYRPDEEEAMNAFWMEENELDGFQWMDGDLPPDTDPKQDAGQGKG
ncbi:MAG: DUF1385 domain-containing protein [Lachnospiraceae bacterium]|nr:DUF1385 domain-containing protein [Lachnospiraceae bacterium]